MLSVVIFLSGPGAPLGMDRDRRFVLLICTYGKRALTLLVSAPYTEAVCGYRSKLIEVIQDGIIIPPPSHQVAGIQGITLLIE